MWLLNRLNSLMENSIFDDAAAVTAGVLFFVKLFHPALELPVFMKATATKAEEPVLHQTVQPVQESVC